MRRLCLLSSQASFLPSAWEQAGWKLHSENPNIDYIAPASGVLAWVDTFAISAMSVNPDAAYAYINFMLRLENAALLISREIYGIASKEAVNYLTHNLVGGGELPLVRRADLQPDHPLLRLSVRTIGRDNGSGVQ